MNILVLYEYRESSANFNISLKIINELENHNINVFHYYLINDIFTNKNSETIEKKWSNSIHSSGSFHYLMHKYDDAWAWKPVSKKILYLIKHPRFFCSYINYKIDSFSMFNGGRKRIEAFCSANKIDIIFGISAPHEIEMIISRLKIRIPKFVFRLDPYAYNPTFPVSRFGKRIKTEQKIISSIDRLFTTDLIIRDLLTNSFFKQYNAKMITIEFPLISEENSCKSSEESKHHLFIKSDSNVYLLHAGYFYSDIRNPKNLVEFMKILPENYKLIVAGYNSYEIRGYDSDIRDRIIDLGLLSRADVNSVIEDCDFLVSYNNLYSNMVPSKLFECIDSGKPFINLCHTEECPTLKYVDGYDMAFSVILSRPFPKNEIISFMERNKGKKSSRDEILSRYGKCTVKYVAGQIVDEIKSAR